MKKLISAVLAILMVCSSLPVFAEEDIQDLATNTDKLYREGAGAQDGAYTALSLSMIGWGIGLAAGIAILCAALHQSKSSSQHSNSSCHN